MFYILFLLKWALVLALLGAGVLSLLKGSGVDVPVIKFKGFEASNLPAGVIIMAAALALAYFWRLEKGNVYYNDRCWNDDSSLQIQGDSVSRIPPPGYRVPDKAA